MKTYRRGGAHTAQGMYIRKNIARTRRRATWVGFVYFVAAIALAVAACMPLFEHELAPVGVMEFYKVFLNFNLKEVLGDKDKLIALVNSVLYAVMLLAVVVNALKGFGKLRWLFKKRGSKTYGFNRNVYAMEDLGNNFSGSLALIIIVYLIIALLCGQLAINTMMLIVLAAGVVVHLLCGFVGCKIGYYDLDNGQIIESKRTVGRIAPFIRNVLQLATVFGVIYFIDYATLNETIRSAMSVEGIKDLLADMNALIVFGAQMFAGVCLFVLIKHATALTEYNIDGACGEGMKNSKAFTFFLFVAAGAALAVKYFLIKEPLDTKLLYVAGIAFVMFVIELIMWGMPKFPDADLLVESVVDDDEVTLESYPRGETYRI